MKRFSSFGEYMFDLLFAPLKKGCRMANQFAIFFRVIGREFDDLKTAIFRVRDEANVASASEIMLPIHGQDRDMPRLEGEDAEAYRTRLSMKGVISEWGGTRKGIQYVLTSLGYEQSTITPVYGQDPERWAEFSVDLGVANANAVKNSYLIFSEVQRVKEASSRLASIVFTAPTACAVLHLGGPAGLAVYFPLLQAEDLFSFRDSLHIGGSFAARTSIPIPEDTPPSFHILRTGGVCTVILNQPKGD